MLRIARWPAEPSPRYRQVRNTINLIGATLAVCAFYTVTAVALAAWIGGRHETEIRAALMIGTGVLGSVMSRVAVRILKKHGKGSSAELGLRLWDDLVIHLYERLFGSAQTWPTQPPQPGPRGGLHKRQRQGRDTRRR